MTGWGESARWDDRRQRLYFVDCATARLHWMDDGGTPTDGWRLPSMATGLVLTEDHRLVAVLDDGLWVLDPDARTAEQLCGNPPGIDGRCNDAHADLDGNLVTGKLNLGPAPGSVWWYSARAGWRLLDDDISNTNGPGAAEIDGQMTLVVGDTAAHYYAYDYDPSKAMATNRRVFGDVTGLEGRPDGACFDREATWLLSTPPECCTSLTRNARRTRSFCCSAASSTSGACSGSLPSPLVRPCAISSPMRSKICWQSSPSRDELAPPRAGATGVPVHRRLGDGPT